MISWIKTAAGLNSRLMAKDMRIISGILKGRPIRFPADIRPTQNKVRKSVFDCLAQVVEGAEFLELFSGSGAVGIEAISCGAKRVTFVDNDFNSLKAIESNLKELDLDERHYRIVRSDAFKFLDDWAGKKPVLILSLAIRHIGSSWQKIAC